MNATSIEWVLNPDGSQGYTLNPASGCKNHDNGLCKGGGFPCYAYKLANTRLKQRYLANHNLPFPIVGDKSYNEALLDPFYPRFWEERLKQIERGYHYTDWYGACEFGAAPKGIFVCDMGDLFGIGIPEEWTRHVLDAISQDSIDRFYLLTKQPQNLIKWSPFPENCYVGVTATNPQAFHEAAVYLAQIRATIKFVSVEPMLTRFWLDDIAPYIDWLIIGACTGTEIEMRDLQRGTYRDGRLIAKYPDLTVMPWGKKWTLQPKLQSVWEIVEAADKAGIPVFLKDNLKPLLKPGYEVQYPWAYKWGEFRQEMAKGEK